MNQSAREPDVPEGTEHADNTRDDQVEGQAEGRASDAIAERPKEIGGPKGPEPTRYGDWEKNGRCTDF